MTEEEKDTLQTDAINEERSDEIEPLDQSGIDAIGAQANLPDETVSDNEVAEEEAAAIADTDSQFENEDSVASESSKTEEGISESTVIAPDDDLEVTATRAELKPVIEALLFVAEEPLAFNQLCKILGDVQVNDVRAALDELVSEYDQRESGLEIREIAGGWRISTRPQHHEFIRKYLKSKPTARLSLPALETLAVIAYKQPITVPEILEIRGVSSTSAIKTLLEKRLIVTKGRKETVGRPMMYGTSKEFLMQFGMRDLSELPSIEDFEDLAG
ncbi:MAG TPA: SMC-Scp complex subunit ScpB [Blastocatellia bacterium]|nr:SMC-Scp complex subunit ScpB [Blastocatellia bacterium]